MTLTDYQRLAMRTHPNLGASPRDDLALGALGLAGEAGEVVELVKKHLYHGADLDLDKLTKELGDALWYVAALAAGAGIDLGTVAEVNIAKLRMRYPEGFSAEASEARMDERPADAVERIRRLRQLGGMNPETGACLRGLAEAKKAMESAGWDVEAADARLRAAGR